MASDSSVVSALKVSVVKISEVKTSAKGKAYIQLNCVHEDGESKVWFSGVAFGALANALAKNVQKGNKMKVNGSVSTKEYINKEGKPGTENKLIINSALVSNGSGVVELDEFSV